MSNWSETYRGGSPEAERLEFEKLAQMMMRAQLKTKKSAGSASIQRAFHAKSVLAARGAELTFAGDLPADLRAGFAQPGQTYPATVRFSNAASAGQADGKKDFRGVALRVEVSEDEQHDLLATNFPVSHARDARQFVVFAHAMAGGTLGRLLGIVRLVFTFGPWEILRMLANVLRGRGVPSSLALETYWSRGAMCWGEDQAVRFLLRPAADAAAAPKPDKHDPNYLERELVGRLKTGDVVFELCLQRYVDDRKTPIEDTSVQWTEKVSPPIPVARLRLSKRDLTEAEARIDARAIEELAFNPWNTTDEFRPLGNLNRARKAVYDASAAHRHGQSWKHETPLRNRIIGGAARRFFSVFNRYVPWHRLPLRASLLNLDAFRHRLRGHNLIDTQPREAPPRGRPVPRQIREEERSYRSFNGRSNDLSDPEMGAVGAAFGRNMQPVVDPASFDDPNPVTVSQELMYRHSFIPAKTLNVLAAAWIQFQVHDWVAHARHKLGQRDVVIPLPDDAPSWANTPGGPRERVMRIAGNEDFEASSGDESNILFGNDASHWWDGSEVYGASAETARALRDGEGPKLRLDDGHLPENDRGVALTGFNESWWMGLNAMHTLFAREHNLLCDELRSHYPAWDDERTYQTARLIVSALIAKIHTVEWTPAILGTRALDVGMKTNWHGPPSNDWLTRLGIWLTDAHALKGIPETLPDHHTAPYSLTEEFATVYRMHPLIPDDYIFFDHKTGQKRFDRSFTEIQGAITDEQMRETGLDDALYSFGVAHPGAITLHNFPRALQAFERNGEVIDLAVVDLVRTRRRGVPRYNGFRKSLHRAPVRRWEDLTANPESNRLLREIYGDIDKVDTVIGLLGETPPDGFGFSDTAFRIFILMATRRLQSDRFLTVDFRPEIYSPFGMDWIANNGMNSVILRHCPELSSVLPRDATAFAPWRPIIPAR